MPETQDTRKLSWRDPDGFVMEVDGRILRAVSLEKADQMRALLDASWMKSHMAKGSIPRTREIPDFRIDDRQECEWMWLEHDRLQFPCYPHELTALQLYDSAQLTLSLALEAVEHGWMLKDASAWNVLHSEGRPVFVDLLSFDKAAPTGLWKAYGQFVRHFVLPLLLYRKLTLTPADIFLSHRDGITPERAFDFLGNCRLLSATALQHVLLPKWLAPAGGRLIAAQTDKNPPVRAKDELSALLLTKTLRRLKRTIETLRPNEARSASTWKLYEEDRLHYSAADIAAKTEFISTYLGDSKKVLDLGCNAGEFSLLAARSGASVVAADFDHAALSRLYERIRESAPHITPLLANIGRPTPAIGWSNGEVKSFLERSSDYFDCILMLGLLHHLLVSERATLTMIVNIVQALNPKKIILEWVDPKDSKFHQLAGFDWNLYSNLDTTVFESIFAEKFDMKARLILPCKTRVMYLWERSQILHNSMMDKFKGQETPFE